MLNVLMNAELNVLMWKEQLVLKHVHEPLLGKF